MAMESAPLGELLVHAGMITPEQLKAALVAQGRKGLRIGSTLISLGFADHDVVAAALARQSRRPAAKRKHFLAISNKTRDLISPAIAAECHAIPLGVSHRAGEELVIAMRDPTDRHAIDRIHAATGYHVRPAAAPESAISAALEQLYRQEPELELAVEVARPRPPSVPRTMSPDVGQRGPRERTLTPAAPAPTPFRPRDSPAAVKWAMLGGVLALAALVVLLPRWFGADGGEDVSGLHESSHLDLSVSFPDGWRYLADEDHAESMMGLRADGALFYRGGTPKDPDLMLMLMRVDGNGQIPTTLDEDEFSRVIYSMERDLDGFDQHGFRASDIACDVTWSRGPLTGECEGIATADRHTRELMMYIWIDTGGILMVAGVLSREPLVDTLDEIHEILDSLLFAD
jgi:hypothetical protein